MPGIALAAATAGPPLGSLAAAIRLGVAGLVGLAVGTEREWSGRTAARRRFAGIRTFFLLGLEGGVAGLLTTSGNTVAGTVLLASGAAFAVVAYWTATRRAERPLDGTTEAAALLVLALSFLAGIGATALAGGAAVVVVAALAEKRGLHQFVAGIDQTELRAALQFAALACVVLPLLPAGPFPGFLNIKPRALWAIVVLFSGVNFAGYLARRYVGPDRGYGLAGILGGMVSSTVVTLQFSRLSRRDPAHGTALALGVVGACAVLPLRVLVLCLVLDAAVARDLLPFMLPAALVGGILVVIGWRRSPHAAADLPQLGNPLRLGSAIPMAAIFELAIVAVTYAQQFWGSGGLRGSALALGMVDADALTASMTRLPAGVATTPTAAHAIAIGVFASVVFKIAISVALGAKTFRPWVITGLGLIGGTLLGTIIVLHATF
ncbi:MAG TPA: MgtC/SapB family protein [Gemmatimonadales bacterium]